MKRNEAFLRDFKRIGDIFDIFEKSQIDFAGKILYNNNCCADDAFYFVWDHNTETHLYLLKLTRDPVYLRDHRRKNYL